MTDGLTWNQNSASKARQRTGGPAGPSATRCKSSASSSMTALTSAYFLPRRPRTLLRARASPMAPAHRQSVCMSQTDVFQVVGRMCVYADTKGRGESANLQLVRPNRPWPASSAEVQPSGARPRLQSRWQHRLDWGHWPGQQLARARPARQPRWSDAVPHRRTCVAMAS